MSAVNGETLQHIGGPSDSDAALCIEYRKQSKCGFRLHPDASAFCERMWRQFPEWYEGQERRVFDETAPFGAQISNANAPADGREKDGKE